MCSVTFDWSKNDAMKKVEAFEKTMEGDYGRLLWVTAEFTEICNHRCLYCYENAGSSDKCNHMKKEDALRLVRYLGESGIRQLTCSGGEPLMYPHIEDVIRTAREYGMVVHMITNGYLLDKARARKLHGLGLSQVQINIDSLNPEKHDYIRGKKGSFKRAVRALKNGIEVGMTCVTQTVVTKLNEDELVDIFKFARKLGVERCRVWDIVPSSGRSLENMHLKPSRNYMDILKDLTDFARKTGGRNIESGDPLFPQDRQTGMTLTGGYCPYSIGLLANVSTEGNSYFCCANRDEPMYNIFEAMESSDPLAEIHQRGLEKALKEMQFFKMPDCCYSCGFFGKCKGGCYMRRKFVDHGKDYWCERKTKKHTRRKSSSPRPSSSAA